MSFNPIVANLLATENLTVIQANVRTASFNIQSRVLTLPTLRPEFEGAYGMLTAHEVGHAKFSDHMFDETFQSSTEVYRQYLNVCEDVRVEKLIKREYPGLRKIMAEGYEVFNKNNFFIPKDINPNSLNFIDRINVYFKCGFTAGVQFTDKEMTLVREVESTETVKDVFIVAEKIYNLAKAESKKKPQHKIQPNNQIPQDEIDDFTDGEIVTSPDEDPDNNDNAGDKNSSDDDTTSDETSSDDGIPSDEDTTSNDDATSNEDTTSDDDNDMGGGGGNNNSEMTDEEAEEMLKSVTDKALSDGMNYATDSSITIINYSLETTFATDPTHSYKLILKNLNDNLPHWRYNTVGAALRENESKFNKFITSTNRVVSHMVKEFEMKKCAHRQRYAQTSKVGQLNMNKLFAYKIRDELFKSITTMADDKNHGMVFLLDWSGSMSNDIHATMCQLMALTMFCRKTKIPFKVLAFTSNIYDEESKLVNTISTKIYDHHNSLKENAILSECGSGLTLLELLSDKMNEREFSRMLRLMFSNSLQQLYSMNSTPLNQALVYMHSFITKYKIDNNIEKLTFVVLTDGAADTTHHKVNNSSRDIYSKNGRVIDPITKDVHVLHERITPTLLEMIRRSSNCTVIGFFVCNVRGVFDAVRINYNGPNRFYDVTENAKNIFKKDGYVILEGTSYDSLYVVNSGDLKEKVYDPNMKEDMSAAALAREMVKLNNTTVSNKLLMGKIINDFA